MTPMFIILNQTVSHQVWQWAIQFAIEHGPIELWSGNLSERRAFGVKIRNLPAYDRRSTMSRLCTWGYYTIAAFFFLLNRSGKTPIYVTTNPPFAPLMVWLLYRFRQQPYVVLEWDIYPQVTEAMSLLDSDHLLYKLWYQWHRRALRDARAVITIGESMAEELRKMAALESFVPVVIPTWVDLDYIQPIDRQTNPFADRHNITDELVLAYSGNIGQTHAIESILALANGLIHRSDIMILIIGGGSKRHLVEIAVQSGQYPNLRLLDALDEVTFPMAMATVDVSIVTLATGYERLSLPSKAITSLAAGCALLSISQGPNDLESLVNKYQCGRNFAPSNVQDMIDWVISIAENRQQLHDYQLAARAAVVMHHNGTSGMTRLSTVLNEAFQLIE